MVIDSTTAINAKDTFYDLTNNISGTIVKLEIKIKAGKGSLILPLDTM